MGCPFDVYERGFKSNQKEGGAESEAKRDSKKSPHTLHPPHCSTLSPEDGTGSGLTGGTSSYQKVWYETWNLPFKSI